MSGLAVDDFNQDGRRDLITTRYAQGYAPPTPTPAFDCDLSVLLGNGDGTFTLHRQTSESPLSVLVGDVNNDARPDLVVLRGILGAKQAVVLLGDGEGGFQATSTLTFAPVQTSKTIGITVKGTATRRLTRPSSSTCWRPPTP
jgi:hypothetical protein